MGIPDPVGHLQGGRGLGDLWALKGKPVLGTVLEWKMGDTHRAWSHSPKLAVCWMPLPASLQLFPCMALAKSRAVISIKCLNA